jgi:hypothetical protein
MLKTFLGDAMDHWGSFNIPDLLLFNEIIPCEYSSHLIKVQFVTIVFLTSIGRIDSFATMSSYDKVKKKHTHMHACIHSQLLNGEGLNSNNTVTTPGHSALCSRSTSS